MMTPTKLSVLMALAGSFGVASLASAQAPDIRNIRPVVMLLVDTSGSMEYRTDVSTENPLVDCPGDVCYPQCGGSSSQRNRWATVVEALTGTFNDFSCTAYANASNLRSNTESPMPGGALFTFDDGFPMPFHRIDDAAFATQANDGILDSYRERVKFGLMTFDGVETLYDQSQLLDLSQYALWTTPQQARFEQYEGGFSYGPNRELYFNGCTEVKIMNGGSKNDLVQDINGRENAGRLISVGDDDLTTLPTLDTINASIQSTLAETRPFGPTPIAGMLDDFRIYLKGEGASFPPSPDVANPATNAAGGDAYYLCRPRFGLLLTDGRPDGDFRTDPTAVDGGPFRCDDGLSSNGQPHRCPYDPAEKIADDLCRYSSSTESCSRDAGGVVDGLFVVALAVNSPAALDRLDDIAEAGGERSGMVDGNGVTRSAYLANDLDTLKGALSAVLDQAAQGATTRTVPAFANIVSGSSIGQYQFSTGFRVSEGFDVDTGGLRPWTGVLERKRYTCGSGATPETEEIDNTDRFQVTLNTQSTRHLWTVVPPKATIDEPHPERGWFTGDITDWHTLPDGPGTATQVPAPSGVTYPTPVTDAELVPFDTGNAATFTAALHAADDTESLDIMNWMVGAPGTVRETRKLGGIYHSSPVVSGPPSADAADESFNYFRQDAAVALRPTVVYVATIDGILHSFAVADFDAGSVSVDGGEELWGFIPPAFLPRLGASRSSYQTLFDGTPVVKEVYLRRKPGQAASPNQYRSVLVAPMGGEAGYVALDVTDPTTPHFLWQFNLPEFFGRTLVQPTITQILMKTDAGLEERAVAILPAGEGEIDSGLASDPANADGCRFDHPFDSSHFQAAAGGDATGSVTGSERGPCWAKKRGRALAMVDVATGALIRLFSDQSPDDAIDEPINGAVSVFPGGQSLVSTRAFTTGGSGRMLRVDYTNPDPNEWKIDVFFDAYYDTTGIASLARQPARHMPVLSTDESGNVIVIQGTGDIDRLEGTAENRVVSLSEKLVCASGSSCDWKVSLNWVEVLDKGGQVTGPIELFDGNVYFATFHSQANPTNACEFGYSLLWGASYLREPATSGNPNPGPSPKPALEVSTGVYAKNTLGVDDYSNQIIMGVGVTQRPSCYSTEVDPYAPGRARVSGQGGGGFELTAHASGASSGSGTGSIRVVSRTLPAPRLVTRASGIAGSTD